MQFTAILLCLSLWWLSEAALELPWHFKYHGVLFLFLCYDCLRQHSGTIIAFGIIYRYLDFICKSVYKLLYFYLVLKSGDCLRQHWYCTLYFTLEMQISCEVVFFFLCYDCLRQHSGKIISFSIVYRYFDFIGKSVCNLQQSYFVFHSGDCLRQHWNCTLYLPLQMSWCVVFAFSAMTVWGNIVGKSLHLVLFTCIYISFASL